MKCDEAPEFVEVDGHRYVHIAGCPLRPESEWPSNQGRSTEPIPCSECGIEALPWEVDDSGRCADCAT